MSPWPTGQYRVAYGVDSAGDRLIVARAERRRGGVDCRVVLDEPLVRGRLADPSKLSSIQAEVLSGDATLAAAMPASLGFARWLETPFASARKARRVLPALLDIQVPFPIESCLYRFPILRRHGAGGSLRALAVAARAADLETRVQALRETGLDPLVLDFEAQCLWSRWRREKQGRAVLVRLGPEHCCIAAGDGPVFDVAHGLRFGVKQLAEPPDASAEAARAHETFVHRAHQVLRSQSGAAAAPVEWGWVGPGALDRDLVHRLEQRLGALSDPPPVFRVLPDPEMFAARALALRALDGASAAWDLRTGTMEHPLRAARHARQARRTAAGWAAAGLLLAAIHLGWAAALNGRADRLQDELTRRAREISGQRVVPRGQEVYVVEQALEAHAAAWARVLRVARPGAAEVLARAMQQAAAQQVRLTAFSAQPGLFNIRGAAADLAHARAFAEAMAEAEHVGDLQTEGDADAGVRFVLRGGSADE